MWMSSLGPRGPLTILHVLFVSLLQLLIRLELSHVLQKPVDQPLIQIRCAGANKHLKHAGDHDWNT